MHIKTALIALVAVGSKNACDHGTVANGIITALVIAAVVRAHNGHFIAQLMAKLHMLAVYARVDNTQTNTATIGATGVGARGFNQG